MKDSLVKLWLNILSDGDFIATNVNITIETTWITANVLVDVVTKTGEKIRVVVDPLQWENSQMVACHALPYIRRELALIEGVSVCDTCHGASEQSGASRYLDYSDSVICFYGWRPSFLGESCALCGGHIESPTANVYM